MHGAVLSLCALLVCTACIHAHARTRSLRVSESCRARAEVVDTATLQPFIGLRYEHLRAPGMRAHLKRLTFFKNIELNDAFLQCVNIKDPSVPDDPGICTRMRRDGTGRAAKRRGEVVPDSAPAVSKKTGRRVGEHKRLRTPARRLVHCDVVVSTRRAGTQRIPNIRPRQ